MIIIFDTETTNLISKGHHYSTHYKTFPYIVQLAYIVCDDQGNELERYNQIVKPNGYVIPIEATKVHGISTQKALAEGIDIKEVIKSFVIACQKCDKIVGHNVYFDMSIVKASILRLGLPLDPLINPVLGKSKRIDTMLKTTQFCQLPSPYNNGFKWPKLEELHLKLFGEEMIDAHDAMVDVEYTKKCYKELIKLNII